MLEEPWTNYEHSDEIFRSLKESKYLRRWLSHFYYQGGENGMPWGVWDPPYQPVGIRREV